VGDYVAGFLGVSEGNAFGLDAFNPIKLDDGSVVTRGQGNHCSVEFNMLYRVRAIACCLWLRSFLTSCICSGIRRLPLPTRNSQKTFSRRRLGSPLIRSGFQFLPSISTFVTRTQINLEDFGAAAGRVFAQSNAPKDREFGGYVPSRLYPLLLFF